MKISDRSSKPKVIMLVESFSIGGAQRVACEIIKNMDMTKVDFHVICFQGKKDTEIEKQAEKYIHIDYMNIPGRIYPWDYLRIIKRIQKYKADVVHAHLTTQVAAIIWSLLYFKPIVITAHTKPGKAFVKKTEFLLRFGLKYGKMYVVAVSKENQILLRSYFKCDPDRFVCINNGIDIERFYHTEHPDFAFINVGRQDENKNQSMILRGFSKVYSAHPASKLILVGDGPCHNNLIDEAKKLGLNEAVEFAGAVGNVEDFYARADVYVQASHREAMPMTALEAMAAGLPVISTNVGGMKDIVVDNGILIDDNDEQALIEMMQTFMDKKYRSVCAEKSKQIVSKYSSQKMAFAYMDLYHMIYKL